jgi:signal transduction histidine kinase
VARLGAPLLETRLGRRLLALFVLCSLVPVTLLAALTLRGVARYEREQTAGYLRLQAKSLAMSLLERLELLTTELEVLQAIGAPPTPPHRTSFTAAGSVDAAGRGAPLMGTDLRPGLPPAARARLQRGRPVLLVSATVGGPPQLLLVVPRLEGGYLWGIVSPEELWKRGSTVPPRIELLVATADGVRLIDSGGLPAQIDAAMIADWSRRSSGSFERSFDGVRQRGIFWTIPMAGNFGTENWVVTLVLPAAAALGPIASFRTSFVQVVVLALLVVVLAASWVIRHTLTPLRQLVEATRRVGSRDFDVELPEGGRDEIQELSGAFRTMAVQLQLHFADLAVSARRLEDQRTRLASLVEHSPYGLVLVDPAGRVELANSLARGYLAALGVGGDRPLREIGGRPLAQLTAWQELSIDGPTARVFVAVARQLAAAGESPPDSLLVLRDVTVERQLERQLQQQERLAAVGQLAAGMAHDLNNVLQGIGMCADLLQPQVASAQAREDLLLLRSLHERAATLIRQVLDFSRRSRSAAGPLRLVAAVNEGLELLRHGLPATVQLELSVGPGAAEVMVSFDPVQLQQVLANLVLNSRDAMPEGGLLDVRVGLAPPSGDEKERVCLAVRDTGSASRSSCRAGSSTRSSPPNPSVREPAWACRRSTASSASTAARSSSIPRPASAPR